MYLILFCLLLPLLVYGLRTMIGGSLEFTGAGRISRVIFVLLLVLLSILFAIGDSNYYLVGYRSTSIVYLSSALAGIVYTLLDRRFILKSIKRIVLNLIAIILMAGSAFLITEMWDDFDEQLVYSDSRFRLEYTARGIMAPCGLPVLFVKEGIVERRARIMGSDTCIIDADIRSVEIKEMDSIYLVKYVLAEGIKRDSSLQLIVRYKRPGLSTK
jgi:hypothetical protein